MLIFHCYFIVACLAFLTMLTMEVILERMESNYLSYKSILLDYIKGLAVEQEIDLYMKIYGML